MVVVVQLSFPAFFQLKSWSVELEVGRKDTRLAVSPDPSSSTLFHVATFSGAVLSRVSFGVPESHGMEHVPYLGQDRVREAGLGRQGKDNVLADG